MESLVQLPQREFWYLLRVNPEPWTVGTLGVGRKKGGVFPTVAKDANLAAYQEAIKEELGDIKLDYEALGKVDVTFYFWRNLARYRTPSGRLHVKHIADATNMQKATEDACQGILFGNDRDNAKVTSVVVAQGVDVEGKVAICVRPYDELEWEDYMPAVFHSKINEWDSATGTPLPEKVYDDTDPF